MKKASDKNSRRKKMRCDNEKRNNGQMSGGMTVNQMGGGMTVGQMSAG